MGRLLDSPIAQHRIARALSWLGDRARQQPLLIVCATPHAGTSLLRSHAVQHGGSFGWEALTLGQLAGRLAAPALVAEQRVIIDGLALSALSARVLHQLSAEGALGPYAEVADRPGMERAVANTLRELSMNGIGAEQLRPHAPHLANIAQRFVDELNAERFADRSWVFDRAAQALEIDRSAWPARPVLWLDVPLKNALEQRLCAALLGRAKSCFATLPSGETSTREALQTILGEAAEAPDLRSLWDDDLARLQHHLFQPDAPIGKRTHESVELISAPGEGREAAEITRHVQRHARHGTRFDRMAVLLRTPERYRAHLTEAFARADIPAYFSMGTLVPDASGRALLSLLRCKAEHLSAERFAEYLSLGVTPDAQDSGAPPEAIPDTQRWVPPELELTRTHTTDANDATDATDATDDPESDADTATSLAVDAPVVNGTLRAPFRWERVLVDAAVIGGRDRWMRRLSGMAQSLRLSQNPDAAESAHEARLERSLREVDSLRAFALPLIDALDALPDSALWGVWLDKLTALATRSLRDPERVITTLHELLPMASVGPVTLLEVELLLRSRLAELCIRPKGGIAGKVFVGSIEEARGLAFDVVFVPGLGEKMFPQKVREDPLLLDDKRRAVSRSLPTNVERIAQERLALRIAVGAASKHLLLSFPRVDTDKGRPRLPSFYGLEAMLAVTGSLPSFDALMRDAEDAGQARMGMPAPRKVADAIDAAEFDLAVLQDFLGRSPEEARGAAHYLLTANDHLARSLRSRARRWTLARFTSADGLVDFGQAGRDAITPHHLSARAYSPSALQTYAACPYRFALRAIFGLTPRETVAAIETLDPKTRGTMIHRAQYLCLSRLRQAERLPITITDLVDAGRTLDASLDEVVAAMHEDLAPAIARVWQDGVAAVRADLHEWLRRFTETDWVPERFELAFGLTHASEVDPASTPDPVTLDAGLRVRGAIDLVEARGNQRRASDHKTGKVVTRPTVLINGGTTLQPLLYALALEKLLPESEVTGGRLYYCTTKSAFAEHVIPLDDQARSSIQFLADTLKEAIEEPFLPAAPDRNACEHCDYRATCGPYEELRVQSKDERRLRRLRQLRGLP